MLCESASLLSARAPSAERALSRACACDARRSSRRARGRVAQIIVFGLFALNYNQTLPDDIQRGAWIYVLVMLAAATAAVYSFIGYAAVVTENKLLCRAHAFGGVLFIVAYVSVAIALDAAREQMIRAIRGGGCYPMLKYANQWAWKNLIDCNKYSVSKACAVEKPFLWDTATLTYGHSPENVGELWSVECVDKSAVAYAWEYNYGQHFGASGVPVALYGCLNRACCNTLQRVFQRSIVFALALLLLIIVMKCFTVGATLWYARHVDNFEVHGKKGERSKDEEVEHAARTRRNVRRNGIVIILCLLVLILVQQFLFEWHDKADRATVLGILDPDKPPQDTPLGGALPTDLTYPPGDATSTDVVYNLSAVEIEYASCAASLGIKNTSTANPPLVQLIQLRTPYCTACTSWIGSAADGILPGASAAENTCVSNSTCMVNDGSCSSGYERCDRYSERTGALVVSDVAVTNGQCKRYSSAFVLAYDATNPLSNSTPEGDLRVTFSTDHGGNLSFPGCSAAGVVCNYTGTGMDRTVTLYGTIARLSAVVDEFNFCPGCGFQTYTINAVIDQGFGGGGCRCGPRSGMNMTVRASSALSQTVTGTILTNGTTPVDGETINGARVSVNLTDSASGCQYNYSVFSDEDGSFALEAEYPLSLHTTATGLFFELDGFADSVRFVYMNATTARADTSRYTFVEGFTAPSTNGTNSSSRRRLDAIRRRLSTDDDEGDYYGYCYDQSQNTWTSAALCAAAGIDTCTAFTAFTGTESSCACYESLCRNSADSIDSCAGCYGTTRGSCQDPYTGKCYAKRDGECTGENETCTGWPCSCSVTSSR